MEDPFRILFSLVFYGITAFSSVKMHVKFLTFMEFSMKHTEVLLAQENHI